MGEVNKWTQELIQLEPHQTPNTKGKDRQIQGQRGGGGGGGEGAGGGGGGGNLLPFSMAFAESICSDRVEILYVCQNCFASV